MKKIISFIVVVLLSDFIFGAKNDSITINQLESKIEILENQVKEVRRDQVNYLLDKNLLKDAYSSNYERLSLLITIGLGLIGLFGYLGLKDINSTKKEYNAELARLIGLKSDLEQKIKEFSNAQIKYDADITSIIKRNEESDKKIKILEFTGKIDKLYTEKRFAAALELCLSALQLDPNDTALLMNKAKIYTQSRSYQEAIQTYLKIIELTPDNNTAIVNLAEVYLFNNQNKEFETLVEKNSQYFTKPEMINVVNKFFKVLTLFNQANLSALIQEVNSQIDPSNLNKKLPRLDEWTFDEVKNHIEFIKDSKQKTIIKNYVRYLIGEINGNDLKKTLDLKT